MAAMCTQRLPTHLEPPLLQLPITPSLRDGPLLLLLLLLLMSLLRSCMYPIQPPCTSNAPALAASPRPHTHKTK